MYWSFCCQICHLWCIAWLSSPLLHLHVYFKYIWGGCWIVMTCIIHFVLFSWRLSFRVQQWATMFSVQLRELTTKYSGSLLMQKVNNVFFVHWLFIDIKNHTERNKYLYNLAKKNTTPFSPNRAPSLLLYHISNQSRFQILQYICTQIH